MGHASQWRGYQTHPMSLSVDPEGFSLFDWISTAHDGPCYDHSIALPVAAVAY